MPTFDEKPVTEMASSQPEGDWMVGKRGGSDGVEITMKERGGLNNSGSGATSRSGVGEPYLEHNQRGVMKLTPPPPPPVSVRGIGGIGHGHVMARAAILVPPWKTNRGEGEGGDLGEYQSLSETQEQSTMDEFIGFPPSSGLSMASSHKESHDSPLASQTPSMEVWSTRSIPSEPGGDIFSDLGSTDNSSARSTAQDFLSMPPAAVTRWENELRGASDCHHPSLDPLRKAALLAREPNVAANKRFGGLRGERDEHSQISMGMRHMGGAGAWEEGVTIGSSVAATNGTNSDRFACESDDAFSGVTEEGVASNMTADRDGGETEYEELEGLDGPWSNNGSTNVVPPRSFHYNHIDDPEKSWNSMDYHLKASDGQVVQSQERDVPSPSVENSVLLGPPNDLFGGEEGTGDAIDDWGVEIATSVTPVESNHDERIPRGVPPPSFMPTEDAALSGPPGGLFPTSQRPCSPSTISGSASSPVSQPIPATSNEVLDIPPAEPFEDSPCTELPPPPSPVVDDHPVKGKRPPLVPLVIEKDESATAERVNGGTSPPIDFSAMARGSSHQSVCDPGGGSSSGARYTTEATSLHFNTPCPPSFPTQHHEFGTELLQPAPPPTGPDFSSPPPVGDLHGSSFHTFTPATAAAEDELFPQRQHVPVSASVAVSAEEMFYTYQHVSPPIPPSHSVGAVGTVSQEKKEGSVYMPDASLPPPDSVVGWEATPESGDPSASAAVFPVNNGGGMFGSGLPQAVTPPSGNGNVVMPGPNHTPVAAPFYMGSSVSVSAGPPSQQVAKSSAAQQQHLAEPDNGDMCDAGSHHLTTTTFHHVAVHEGPGGSSAADTFGAPPAAGFHSNSTFDSSLLGAEHHQPGEASTVTEEFDGPPDGMFGALPPSDELSTSSCVKPVEVASSTDDCNGPPDRMFLSPASRSCSSLFNSTRSSDYSPVYNVPPGTAVCRAHPPTYDYDKNKTFTAAAPAIAPIAAYSQAGGHVPAESQVVAHMSHFDEAPSAAVIGSDAVHQGGVVPQFGGRPPGQTLFYSPPGPSAAGVSTGPSATEVGGAQNTFYQSSSAGYRRAAPHHTLDPSCASLPGASPAEAQNHTVPPQYPPSAFPPTVSVSEEPVYARTPYHVSPEPASTPSLPTVLDVVTSEVAIYQPKITFAAAAASVPTMEKAKTQGRYHPHGRPSHAVASLGFGGRLVIVQPYSHTAEVWNVKDVTTLSYDIARDVEEFPGPAEISKLADITHFCEMKSAGRNGEGKSERLIWGSVFINLKHSSEGQRVPVSQADGNDETASREKELSTLLKESQLRSTAGMRIFLGGGGRTITPESEIINVQHPNAKEWGGEIKEDIFQTLEGLLIEGKCEAAVQLAFLRQQWALGLLIALHDRESKSFEAAVQECVSNCIPPGHSTLSTAVLSLAGLGVNTKLTGPQDLLNSWKLVAASYLTSNMNDYQEKLVKLGDDLLMYALTYEESGSGEQQGYYKTLTHAAHTLYIMAGLAPQKPGKQSRMVLPGIDFSNPALRSFRSPESWDAMHILEVLEIIHGSELTPVVLGHKLRLAMALADIGWLKLAEAYTNQVRKAVNSLAKSKKERGNMKSIPYTDKFVEALSNFEDRVALALGKSPPSTLGERGAGRWLLKKMTDMVKSSSSISSLNEPKPQQQPVGPQETHVGLSAAGNLPGSLALAHNGSNGATTTLHQPFGHKSPYQPSDEFAVNSEAQPMRQQYGSSPFVNVQQNPNSSPPQVLFHPYTSKSTQLQQQEQHNAVAGSSVATKPEEPPSLQQSAQSQQPPAAIFHPIAQNLAMQHQGQTPPHLEQPIEYQQLYPSPHLTASNSNMYAPTTAHREDHHGVHSEEALENNATTTNLSSTLKYKNDGKSGLGSIKSAPTSAHTTPHGPRERKHSTSEKNTPTNKSKVKHDTPRGVGFLSSLVQKVTKVVHPEATVADLGGDMQAYWDKKTKKWVFPTAPEGDSVDGGAMKQEPKEAEPIPNSLAALMAPPPILAFGAGKIGANHTAFTNGGTQNEPPPPSPPVQHPTCWTPAGTGTGS